MRLRTIFAISFTVVIFGSEVPSEKHDHPEKKPWHGNEETQDCYNWTGWANSKYCMIASGSTMDLVKIT